MPSRRATQGSDVPCTSVKTTTSTKTVSKMTVARRRRSAVSGNVASTMGTAPRSPAHEMKACCGHGMRNQTRLATTDSGRATSSSAPPTTSAGPSASPEPGRARPAGRAGRTGRSGRGRPCPRRTRCSPRGAAAARCRGRGRRGRPPRSRTCARATPRRTPARTARAWPAGRSRPAAARRGAAAAAPPNADRHADDRAADQLAHDLDADEPPRLRCSPPVRCSASAVTSRITGASLSPLSASRAAAIRRGQRQPAQRREDRGRVGRAHDRARAAARCPRSSPSSPTVIAAVTPTLTATPTVARASPGPIARRTSFHRVVRPPSARMTTSAATPEGLGELGVLEVDAEAALPQRRRRARGRAAGSAGPSRSASRSATAATRTTSAPIARATGDRGVHRPPLPMGAVSRTRTVAANSICRVGENGRREAPGPFRRPSPAGRPARPRAADPAALGGRQGLRPHAGGVRRQAAVGVLRGPADRQRPPGHAPHRGARVQGRLPPVQDHAGLARAPPRRLGLPRPAGRDRRRAGARLRRQARHRALRHRRVQRPLPRVGRAARRRRSPS